MSTSSLDFIIASMLMLQNAKEAFNKANYDIEIYLLKEIKEDIEKALSLANREFELKEKTQKQIK